MLEERNLLCPTIDHWKKNPVSVFLFVENASANLLLKRKNCL